MSANKSTLHKTHYGEWAIILVLLSPLLVLNLINGQHWGDDFAQYILQAKNISEGISHDSTGFVFNSQNLTYAPPVYPVGFPLLLAPLIKIFGSNILIMNYFMASIFMLWGIVCYYFFRNKFSSITSAGLLFIMLYPNFFMWLKASVLSDIPFSVLFLIILLILNDYKKRSYSTTMLAGIITGYLISIRNPGITLIAGFGAALFWQLIVDFYKTKRFTFHKPDWLKFVVYSLTSLLIYYLITYVFFPTKVEHFGHYSGLLKGKNIVLMVAENIMIYINHFRELFISTDASLIVASNYFSWLMLFMLVAGCVFKWLIGPDLIDWTVLLYTLLIILYPVSTQGYRFLTPVHPVYMFYLFSFFSILLLKNFRFKLLMPIATATICFVFYFDHLKYVFQHRNDVVDGPYEEICLETFDYIKNHVPDDAIIVFTKPRALTLFTGKKSIIYSWEHTPEQNHEQMKNIGAHYYLHTWKLNESEYVKLLDYLKPQLELVYQNWQFKLYREKSSS